jgi:hypothetical protein
MTGPCLTLVFALVSCAQLPDTEGPRVREPCHRVHSEKSREKNEHLKGLRHEIEIQYFSKGDSLESDARFSTSGFFMNQFFYRRCR